MFVSQHQPLWPFNVQDVLEDCLAALDKGKAPELQAPAPHRPAARTTGQNHLRSRGRPRTPRSEGSYENLVKTQAKYSQNELAIKPNRSFAANGRASKTAFNVKAYQDHKGVIRRIMSVGAQFAPFVFCQRAPPRRRFFRLHSTRFACAGIFNGMQTMKPLLLKLAVNITP